MSIPPSNLTQRQPSRGYVPWFWGLIVLFIVRVIAQPTSLIIKSKFLPSFESWHGGVLPYPVLLISQMLIIAWMVYITRQFHTGSVIPNYRIGKYVLIIGSVYFLIMLVRLTLGLTILSAHRWFGSTLPAFFHLVLASFLLLYGHFHVRFGRKSQK